MSKRTITLTGRPPVTIDEDKWPLVASVKDDEYDGQVKCQSFRTTDWFVGVRQHEDGRAIVYAKHSFDTAWQSETPVFVRRGELLDSGDSITDAIFRVCADVGEASGCDRWDALAHECVADLPAVELT